MKKTKRHMLPANRQPARRLRPRAGTASQFVLMRAAGAVAGGLAGLACMYLTLAANGGSYANTATKGAVMVTLLSALTFFFSLLRFHLPRFWFAFTVATFRRGARAGWARAACRLCIGGVP